MIRCPSEVEGKTLNRKGREGTAKSAKKSRWVFAIRFAEVTDGGKILIAENAENGGRERRDSGKRLRLGYRSLKLLLRAPARY
jgi:hypothetical protein